MKILVVDDNRSYHWIHRRKLNHLKASISFVECPDEAVSKISNKNYDVILIQHRPSERCTGPELYDKIRQKGYRGPIFVLFSDKETKRQDYNGIEKLVHKKTSGRELCDMIMETLQHTGRQEEFHR